MRFVKRDERIVEYDEGFFVLERSVYQRQTQTQRYDGALPRAEIFFAAQFAAPLEFYPEIFIHIGVFAEFFRNFFGVADKCFERRRDVLVFEFLFRKREIFKRIA